MENIRVEYYSYKSFRHRCNPRGVAYNKKLPWQQESSDLLLIRLKHVANSFDELVEYLDNSGDSQELHTWILSASDNPDKSVHPYPYRNDKNEITTARHPGVMFHGHWFSFTVVGYTLSKQLNFNK